jgi:hypothetical protein
MSDDGPVCAWCDVYCRVERVRHDEETGKETMRYCVCVYCGRTELRLRKLGRQTPIPPPRPPRPDCLPFWVAQACEP